MTSAMTSTCEFPQLKNCCYLDHAGATIPSTFQIMSHAQLLTTTILGNPHSVHGSGAKAEEMIHSARDIVLRWFGTSSDEYSILFLSGATAALKLVGECYDFGVASEMVYLDDNHTSAMGIREYALAKKVKVTCVTRTDLELSSNENDVEPATESSGLFVYPAQSNFSGFKYPLSWAKRVKKKQLPFTKSCSEWHIMLDIASYVSTSPLHLSGSDIDFACVSFYKIFGYPTGIGALLVKNTAAHKLRRTYFGGGTIEGAGVHSFFHFPRSDISKQFEDGTLPFQQIASLQYGFEAVSRFGGGMNQVQSHTFKLAKSAYSQLVSLRHYNGTRVVELYCETSFDDAAIQGPIVNFNLKRSNGEYIGFSQVERLASLYQIQFRVGCFCNIGACQKFLHLSTEQLQENHRKGRKCGDNVDIIDGMPTGSIRISFGYMSTVSDVDKLIAFVQESFVEKELPIRSEQEEEVKVKRLHKIFIYPIKSCGAFEVCEWEICDTGLLYDRMWMVVDSRGRSLTQKTVPALCRIIPIIALERGVLQLTADGFESLEVMLGLDETYSSSDAELGCVKVCGERVSSYDCGTAASDWLCAVLDQRGCRLIRKGNQERISSQSSSDGAVSRLSLVNVAQYLLIGLESVTRLCQYITDQMNSHIDGTDALARFRPNLVVSGGNAGEENDWNTVVIGSHVFTVQGLCERCAMVSVDQKTGEKTMEPLRSLSLIQRARTTFGILLSHTGANSEKIRVGDPVTVKELLVK